MADPLVTTAPLAPTYGRHRHIEAVAGMDTLPVTDRTKGINMGGYKNAHIQVVTDTASAPQIQVQWWSENSDTPAFIDDESKLLFPAKGAGIDWEITIPCEGREMLVAVIVGVGAGEEAWIYVAGSD